MKHICQAITTATLHQVLQQWCEDGASDRKWVISAMTAFISGRGVELVEPLIDVFLSSDNRVQLIFGANVGGTDRAAVQRLDALVRTYHEQIKVWAWDPAKGGGLFHPKLYLCEAPGGLSAIIGSSNLTLGGLGRNHESLLHFNHLPRRSREAAECRAIWEAWAKPADPRFRECLRPLTPEVAAELEARLTDRSADSDLSPEQADSEHKGQVIKRGSRTPRLRLSMPRNFRDYLVMDILDETRQTQVQPPAPVMEAFFHVVGTEPATFRLSLFTGSALSPPFDRVVVTSNYMRRIEIPQIRGLERPCAIIFARLPGPQTFAYRVLARGSREYQFADDLLNRRGVAVQRRRFYIGASGDVEWERFATTIAGRVP